MRYSLLWAAAGLLGSISAASAACQVQPFRFFPAQNDSVSTTATTNDGACRARFSAGGGSVFTAANVVGKPRNGTLTQAGSFMFEYRAKSGYKGADAFTVQVCGSDRSGQGCSKITYNMIVQ